MNEKTLERKTLVLGMTIQTTLAVCSLLWKLLVAGAMPFMMVQAALYTEVVPNQPSSFFLSTVVAAHLTLWTLGLYGQTDTIAKQSK